MMALFLVAVLLVGLIALCLSPLLSGTADDHGDGRTTVHIPQYTRTPPTRPRTIVFFLVSAALCVAYVGWQSPSPSDAFENLVGRLASYLTADPAGVSGFVAKLQTASQLLGVSFLLGLAVVARATLARRLLIAAHILLYLALTVLAEALMIDIGVETGWPVQPFAIEATLMNLALGGLVVARVMFTSFYLPRPTTTPNRRPRWIADTVLAAISLVCVAVLLEGMYAVLTGPAGQTALRVLIPMYASNVLFVLLFVPLAVFGLVGRPQPPVIDDRPPIDVLIPAFNEQDNLDRLIRSIDISAGRYKGPVRMVVSNDGSQDSTEQVARTAISRLQHVRGEVLNGRNGGQAQALNRALAVTDAEICIRIDADCVMGADALIYAATWFQDPSIGSVGAMMMPRRDTITWFHRMRALETLFQFRFARAAQGVVDGIVVIPGTFSAFRRTPAVQAGGFPTGMNGEDADLTLQIGRAGYRVVVDHRFVSYEDVPRSAGEFVEQRTRWSRAGVHVFARHNPFALGSAGPRVWFWTIRRMFSWFSIQAGIVGPVYVVLLALTHPSYRRTIATVVVLYMLAGALPLLISLPLAIRYRQWASIAWMPTWFAFAFLRRLAMLEATLSLPGRPISVHAAATGAPGRPAAAPASPALLPRRPALRS